MNAPATTRRAKVEAREDAIIAVARELFNTKGFAKTTMAEIARESGVADGTVYIYFKNKEAVARAALADFYADLTESAQNGVDALSTPQERIAFLAKHHLESVTEHWRLLELLPLDLKVDAYEGSALYALNKAYVAVFDRVAKDGRAQGVIRNDLTPWIMRDIFFGAMEHGARSMVFSKKLESLERVAEDLVTLLCVIPKGEGDVTSRLEQVASRLEASLERMT